MLILGCFGVVAPQHCRFAWKQHAIQYPRPLLPRGHRYGPAHRDPRRIELEARVETRGTIIAALAIFAPNAVRGSGPVGTLPVDAHVGVVVGMP